MLRKGLIICLHNSLQLYAVQHVLQSEVFVCLKLIVINVSDCREWKIMHLEYQTLEFGSATDPKFPRSGAFTLDVMY